MLNMLPEKRIIFQSNKIIDTVHPIFNGTKHIAWARIGINLKNTEKNLQSVLLNGAIYTAIAIILGILIAYFMGNYLTNSIYSLMDILEKTSHGTRYLRAKRSKIKEIDLLSNNINQLFCSYESNEKELSLTHKLLEDDIKRRVEVERKLINLNLNLEDQVLERTIALITINDNLKNTIKKKEMEIANLKNERI